jgi:hypothetical protein
MMNLTGDGNGIDMISLSQDMREQVPRRISSIAVDMTAIQLPAEIPRSRG